MLASNRPAPADAARRAQLMMSVLRTMVAMGTVGLIAALIDRRNDPLVSVVFYAPIFAAVLWMRHMVKRGHVLLTAWVSSMFFWVLIAFVTLCFGGLQGGNAACFGVCTMMVGSLVGGRAAIAVAAMSSAWCGLVAVLEVEHALPMQLGPYTPINAWTAITVTLVMMSVLLRNSLESIRAMHAQAATIAAERDEALRRSIQAQKMELVGNLAGGVAHDFNNLLMVIVGVSEALREDQLAERSSPPQLLDDLDAATERAMLMTRQLLTVGRVQAGELAPVDLGELVRVFALLLPRLIGPTIKIEVETDPDVVAHASRVGIEQILLNLAVNARDAMPDGGTLGLRVLADARHVRLLVADSGSGMSTDVQRQAFTPFFTTKTTGTGLGLATVRSAVERFGGTIEIASEPGKGTTFEIRIARVIVDRPAPKADPPALAATSTTRRLLLAEDDPLVGRVMVRIFEQAGFDVVAVVNGAEALALIERTGDFACVVSDISMPILDGLELAARLAVSHPSLPVLLVSGDRAPPQASSGAPRGFVAKPIERRGLLAALEQLISG